MAKVRLAALAALLSGALLALPPAAFGANPSITDYFQSSAGGAGYPCPATYGDPRQRVCSGVVPSFDGMKLDVDLTLPFNDGPGQRHPLIVMLHGLGGNKRNWESTEDDSPNPDKWHWNSHWFAEHGYYVLTYTARGHRDDRPNGDEPATPGAGSVDLPSGTAHLKSRDFEIKDTQWLAALVAAGFPTTDPKRVAVTGGSYGGGESWTQASQAEWTFPRECSQREDAPHPLPECQVVPGQPASLPKYSPPLPALSLQVAAAKYGWTDLGYSVAPNGHGGGTTDTDIYESSTGHPDSPTGQGNPVGVMKESYVDELFGLGPSRLVFEEGTTLTPNEEGPYATSAWYGAIKGGDPYDVAGTDDPIIAQARRGISEFRSSYYQDENWANQKSGRKVAIFAIQGWTDDLFPAVEAFRQFKYLKRLDPLWPVALAVADIGHSRGQNKPATWRRLNGQAWQFLQSNINGSHEQTTTVYSEPTTCADDGDPDNNLNAAQRFTALSPEGLAHGRLTVTYRPGQTESTNPEPPAADDQDNLETDPSIVGDLIAQDKCRESQQPEAPRRYTAVSAPLRESSTFVGLGEVTLPYTLTGATTAVLNARVWDVAPSGPTLLVTRGTYRIDTPAYDQSPGVLRLPLFGNHWQLRPGHKLRLDLTQHDNPTFRSSNLPSTIEFGPPKLKLPIRESDDLTLPGG